MKPNCACDEYRRASAGRGLPVCEPGMPDPAGTGLSRRSFLSRSVGLGMAIYGGGALAPAAFEAGIADAMAAPPTNPILVSIFMSGGIDPMNVLVPLGKTGYTTARNALRIPASDTVGTFTEDLQLSWHEAAAGLRTLHLEGKVSVMPAVHYQGANQSHFTSRHYYEVGATDPSGRVGWMGRYLDAHGTPDNPLQGLALGWTLSPSLAPLTNPVATVASPEYFALDSRDVWDSGIRAAMPVSFGRQGSLATQDPELLAARRAVRFADGLRTSLAPMQGTAAPWQQTVSYPSNSNDFPRRLQALAQMIGMGLPLRCVALEASGGYDTHDNQVGALAEDMPMAFDSIVAFQRDLEARGVADRVLIHVWSEFGRRVAENGSGTDHGEAGLGLLIGTRVRGQMIGEHPGLTSLSHGSLHTTSDFRGVYAALLEQWFGVDPEPLIPGLSGLPDYDLIKP